MLDRPDAATLLKAMAATLSDEVLPTTSGSARHSVRVIANLCLILEREVSTGASAAEQTRQSHFGRRYLVGQAVNRGDDLRTGNTIYRRMVYFQHNGKAILG